MTKDRDFKRMIRARAAQSGRSYQVELNVFRAEQARHGDANGEKRAARRMFVVRSGSDGRYLIEVGHFGWRWGTRDRASEWSDKDVAFLKADPEYGRDLVEEEVVSE